MKNNHISGRSSSGIPWWQVERSSGNGFFSGLKAFNDSAGGPEEEALDGEVLPVPVPEAEHWPGREQKREWMRKQEEEEAPGQERECERVQEREREQKWEWQEKGKPELKAWGERKEAKEARDTVFLRCLFLQEMKKASCYLGMSELLRGEKGEFFYREAEEEVAHSKLILGLLGWLDPVQKCELEALYMQKVLDAAGELCGESLDLLWMRRLKKEEEAEFFEKIVSSMKEEKKKLRRREREPEREKKEKSGYRDSHHLEHTADWQDCLLRALAMEVEIIDSCEWHYAHTQSRGAKHLLEYLLRQEKHHLALFSRRLLEIYPGDP